MPIVPMLSYYHSFIPLLLLLTWNYFNNLQTVCGYDSITNRCEARDTSHPQYEKCPQKRCNQHIDCWVSFGAPQRCVCDPIVCGSVCLPENAKCPNPPPLADGTVTYNETDVGEIAEYSCRPGLVVRGPRKRHCLATLTWSGLEPVCSNQTETCFSPPYMPNTRIVAGEGFAPIFKTTRLNGHENVIRDDFRSGEVIKVECLPGYEDENNKYTKVSCVGAEWHFTEFRCERVSCGAIEAPKHGHIQYKTDHKYGAEATIHCNQGYSPLCSPPNSRTEDKQGCKKICLHDGSWSGGTVYCNPVLCTEPEEPDNGRIVDYSTSVNGTVTFECMEGYKLEGSRIRNCHANGKWDGLKPSCLLRDCGYPPKVEHGHLTFKSTTYGSQATIQCDPDTTLFGETDQLECGVKDDETLWLPQPRPACYQHCFLFTVEHGEVVLMHTLDNGQPNHIPITTEGYRNGAPEAGHNSMLVGNGIILPGGRVRHGSLLNVTCRQGYQLVKPEHPITECNDGVWSIRSKCTPASCKRRPTAIPGTRVRFYSLKHNARARYEPYPGYRLHIDDHEGHSKLVDVKDPKGVIRCLYGEWVGIPVRSEPMHCPSLKIPELVHYEYILNGSPLQTNKHDQSDSTIIPQQGLMIRFSCPDHYTLQGPKVLVCHEGRWNPIRSTPECLKTKSQPIPHEWFYRIS